jgi:DNA helicase-2/ATP-dependent DNA helicase PcrA
MSLHEENGLEEERRLFYVATTRAMDSLTLCVPSSERQGESRLVMLRRSRFVDELFEMTQKEDFLESWMVKDA